MRAFRRLSSILSTLAVFTFAAVTPTVTSASTVLKVDVSEMTRISPWVVRARVTAVASVDLRKRGESIYTDVTLAIDEFYKGPDAGAPKTTVMRLPGGLGDDGMALTVPGMPTFKVGDDVVLFLEMTGLGPVPCGMEQGVWRVYRGALGYLMVTQSTARVSLVERDKDGRLVPSHDRPVVATKLLDQLKAEVRAAR